MKGRKTMKFKKALASVAAAAMLASALSGCGSKTASSDSDNTITWYMSKAVENTSNAEMVMEEANRIIGDKLGLKLDLHLIDMGNYSEKMNVMLSSREKMDICFINKADQFSNGIKNGSFVELTDEMLNEYAPAIVEKTEDILWKLVTVNGKKYGIKGQAPLSSAKSIVFKKDLVEKYNFDYKSVTCLADLEPYLQTLKENEPNVIPLLYQTPDKVSQRYTDTNIKTLVFDEEEQQYKCLIDTDEFTELYRLKNDYYKKGYIAKDAITKTEYLTECKSGNYAVMCNTGYYSEDGSKSTGAYGFPTVETYVGSTVVCSSSASMNCISSTSDKPEKALQLLNLVWEDEYLLNTLAYGVEGVDYKIDEQRTQEIGSKSVIPNTGNMQTWGIWHNWLGPLWTQWDSSWNKKEALETMRETNTTAQVSAAFGFRFDSEPVKTEYAKCCSVYEEYDRVLSTGSMTDFDTYYADARQKLAEAGIDAVIEEANRQYREWKQSNS